MSKVAVLIHEELASFLGSTSSEVERRVAEALVLELFRQHDISTGKGARLLGMDYLAFVRWAGERGVPFIDMTPEEWQQELRTISAISEMRMNHGES